MIQRLLNFTAAPLALSLVPDQEVESGEQAADDEYQEQDGENSHVLTDGQSRKPQAYTLTACPSVIDSNRVS